MGLSREEIEAFKANPVNSPAINTKTQWQELAKTELMKRSAPVNYDHVFSAIEALSQAGLIQMPGTQKDLQK